MCCEWCQSEANLTESPQGTTICQECWDTSFVPCNECGDDIDFDDAERSQANDYYCETCYGRSFTLCIDCGAEVEKHTSDHHDLHGNDYCDACFCDRFVCCASCDTFAESCDVRTAPNGEPYCDDCFTDTACNCAECDCAIWLDESYDASGGGSVCSNCRHSAEWRASMFNPVDPTYTDIQSERRFGVEFETSVCEAYHELQGETVFGAKPDGSVDGMEFVSPVLYADQGLEEINNLCRLSRERSFEVDSSCGLHVHLDMTDATEDQLYSTALAYHYTYDLWMSFVSNARVRNYYCAKHDYTHTDCRGHGSFRDFVECATYSERYRWINWAAYLDHRTVEIRFHGGTLSASKTVNWVKIHTRFIDVVQDMTITRVTRLFGGKTTSEQFAVFADLLNDDELITFYAERAEHFGKSVMVEESEESEGSMGMIESACQEANLELAS